MENLLPKMGEVLRRLMFSPQTDVEFWVTVVVAVVLFLNVYGRLGDRMGVPRANVVTSVIVGMLGALVYALCLSLTMRSPSTTTCRSGCRSRSAYCPRC